MLHLASGAHSEVCQKQHVILSHEQFTSDEYMVNCGRNGCIVENILKWNVQIRKPLLFITLPTVAWLPNCNLHQIQDAAAQGSFLTDLTHKSVSTFD